MKNNFFWKKVTLSILILLAINFVADNWSNRFDLTEDRRFTLSEETLKVLNKIETPVTVDVLLDGQLPTEFARLQKETLQLLDEFKAKNKHIRYTTIDPLANAKPTEIQANLQQIGLKPATVTLQENGKVSQEVVFPWAMVNAGDKTFKVSLLKNKLGSGLEERINNSVQQLEYAFADALTKISIDQKKSVAVIKGNGQLQDAYMADFLLGIQDYYNIGPFTLDSVQKKPQKTLRELRQFDLALIAKPTVGFTEKEKYVLDQFMVSGGKTLWLVDKVAMELDSLLNKEGTGFASIRDLNLDDLFFKYGVRVNPILVNDMYNTPIVLASGEGTNSEYNPLPWQYHPMVFSKNNHPINNNIEALRFQFANAIDTLPNSYQKTILLQSSPLSKGDAVPREIKLASITKKPNPQQYQGKGTMPLAVLVEGSFSSAYTNRIKPFKTDELSQGPSNKMIVIADGDVIKNQLKNGQPLELGYDKWTNGFYGNKEFLTNCVNYLLNDDSIINLRSKVVAIPLLDSKKIAADKQKWQMILVTAPLVLVVLTGSFFIFFRKKTYAC